MKTFETDGTSYVTAKEIKQEYQISHRKCWEILHKNRDDIRSFSLGNIGFYAFEDVVAFFHDVKPSKARK